MRAGWRADVRVEPGGRPHSGGRVALGRVSVAGMVAEALGGEPVEGREAGSVDSRSAWEHLSAGRRTGRALARSMSWILMGVALATPIDPTDADALAAEASAIARSLASMDEVPPWRWDQLRAIVAAWEGTLPPPPSLEPETARVCVRDAVGRAVADARVLVQRRVADCKPLLDLVRCGPGAVTELLTDAYGVVEVTLAADAGTVAMALDGRRGSLPATLGSGFNPLTLVPQKKVVVRGPRPATLQVSGKAELTFPVDANEKLWAPVGAALHVWGPGVTATGARVPKKGKVKLKLRPGADDLCALAEEPEEVFPCHAFPTMPGLKDRSATSRDDGLVLLHAPVHTLPVEGELRGVRLWTDTPDPIEPDPARPRARPTRTFPSALPPRDDGSRSFTAHVHVDGRSVLLAGRGAGRSPVRADHHLSKPTPRANHGGGRHPRRSPSPSPSSMSGIRSSVR